MASFAAPLKAKQHGEFDALCTGSCDLWIKRLFGREESEIACGTKKHACMCWSLVAGTFLEGDCRIDIRCVLFASDRDLPTFHGSHASPGQVREISR